MLNARFRCYVVLCVVVILTTGCALTHHVRQELLPQSAATAMVQRWPLAMGLYIPPAVRSRELAHQAWRMQAGEPIANNFRWALEQMFEQVVELDRPPSARAIPQGLAGIIELSHINFQYGVPGSIGYGIVLYSGSGDRIDGWSETSPVDLWDMGESSLSASMYGVGTEIAYAMRNVIAQYMLHFADRPKVQSWLSSEGVTQTMVRPYFREGGAAALDRPKVLLVPNARTWLHTDGSRAMECLGRRLTHASPPFEVTTSQQVRLAFFPWLEPSTAPKTVDHLQRWLADPAIRKKMQEMGVRYLLEFSGETKTDVPGGGMLCGAGYGGGGCLGFSWGSRESSFSATLLDMWQDGVPFHASATQRGSVYIPAFILPVPIMAATETKACDEVARRIHDVLRKGIP